MCSGRLTLGALIVLAVSTVAVLRTAHADCVVSSNGMSFGMVDTEQGSNASGMVTISCNEPTAFAVAISSGGNLERRMLGPGGDVLDYQLYTDSSRSTVWGDGNGASELVSGQNDGENANQLPLYGTIPPQSGVRSGDYRDDLTLTVQF